MNIRFLSLLTLVYFISSCTFAQTNLNAYKYITVPKNFNFLTQEDQYQVNSLTKFLFDKQGFETLFDVDMKPQELLNNSCLNLTVDVTSSSSMLTTKLTVNLMNCKNEVVYSHDGRSKLKEYRKAYHEAVRKALEPLKNLNYKYNPEQTILEVKSNEVRSKVEENTPVKIVATEIGERLNDQVNEVEAQEKGDISKISKIEETKNENMSNANLLYAQKTTNGYQLVDSSPKVIYVLQKTSDSNLFILKHKNGIVFTKKEKWYIEYYHNDELIQKELNIKF